ncbi:MAG TPA: asparagine synthetase B family protein, partial [Magnetovibrio sp.]
AGRSTVHDKIFELPAGHAALFKNGALQVHRYWYPASGEFRNDLSLEDATDQLDSLICETMREWTISDVPVGALVSGGLDSTLVSYLSARDLDRLDMFTVFFPDHSAEVDERHLAVLAAKAAQREHIEVPFYDNYIPGNLERLIAHFDEPLQDTNSLTFMGLSEYIQQNSDVKAVITGEGSDEMFGGYQRHRIIADEYEKTGDPSVLMYAMNKVALPRLELFAETTAFDNPERLAIVENLISKDAVGMGLELDQICFLPGYLQRVDQIGMMFGLEMRPPLLDHRLVRFANALPKRLRMHQEPDGHHWHKYLVRKVAERYMPDKIVWNREKYQFMIPAARMLYDGPLRTMFLDLFTQDCELSSHYDIKGILKLLDMHRPITEGGDDHSNTLGRLLSMEIWLRARKANPGGKLY